MERNVYLALGGLAILGLLLNFEWLFLTFILIAAALFFAERMAQPANPFSSGGGGEATAAAYSQQPIVIQSGAHNPANTMMMDMISNIVQESTYGKSPHSPFRQMQHHFDHKLSAIDSKLRKLDKKFAEAAKKDGHGGHGHH